MNEVILNQVKTTCPCFEDSDLEAMLDRLFSLLSISLCWNSETCSTFLKGNREETFDYVNDSCMTCKPCERYKKYPLFWYTKGADIEISEVKLITYSGLAQTETIFSENQYVLRKNTLIIDSTLLPSNCCTCSCDEFELVVSYISGYEQLPTCILPVICDLLTSMSLSLQGCGSINDCCQMRKPKAWQILKSKKLGEIAYTWEIDKTQVSYLYNQMFTQSMIQQIAQLSCCNGNYNEERLWYKKSC